MDKDRFSDGVFFKWINQKEIYAKYDNKGRARKIQAYLDKLHEDYIATRPGADFGDDLHGIFGYLNGNNNLEKVDLEELKKYVANMTNKNIDIYKTVISLSEEDAIKYGYTTKKAWKDLVVERINDIGNEFGIKSENIEWTASYHSKKNNPHCHVLFWNKNQNLELQKKPYVRYKRIRKALSKSIFKIKLKSLYDIKNVSKKRIANMTNEELEKYKQELKEFYKNPDLKLRITDLEKEEKIILDSLKNMKINDLIYICDIEEPTNFSEIRKIEDNKYQYKNYGEQSILYRENSYVDTAQFLANFSDLKVCSSQDELEKYIETKKQEHINIENNLREIMPDIFGIPIISNKFKEENYRILLNKIIELKNVSNNFEKGYKYKYQIPEVKMYINEISKLILNTSVDCRNKFDDYVQSSINASRILAEINNKKEYEKVKRIAENEMLNKIGNQILQLIKEISFEEYLRKKQKYEENKIRYEEMKGIKKANEEQELKNLESKNARKIINDVFFMLSEENISRNAYYNRIKNTSNLSKQAKKEIYLKNRLKSNIDWGIER